MNRRVDTVTVSPWGSHVASMGIDSHRILSFCVSRKRVVTHALRKASSGVSPSTTPSVLWNYMSQKRNCEVGQWDLVFVYLYYRRQKKSPIWIRYVVHFTFSEAFALAHRLMTSPRGWYFLLLDGRLIGRVAGHSRQPLVEVFGTWTGDFPGSRRPSKRWVLATACHDVATESTWTLNFLE